MTIPHVPGACQLAIWAVTITAVANRIREHRLNRKLTQRQLAELAGCDQAQVAHWELGDWGPRLGPALALARALNVAVEELGLEEERAAP